MRRIATEEAFVIPEVIEPFASHEDGNHLSEESQWAKLRQIVELAQEIWPDA